MRSNMTYGEERDIYKNYKLIEGRKAENKKYMIIQKLLGAGCICLSVIEIIAGYKGFLDDGGLSLVMIPLGIYLATTKTQVL